MFRRIIVGVDGRDGGRDALALSAVLRAPAGDVVALHAYPYDPHPTRAANADFEAALIDASRTLLADELARAGVEAEAEVAADGSPGRALQHAAARHEADLIVVGSAHRGPVGRVLAGDVTAGTLQGASCPVAVAPRGYAEHPAVLRRVGVGVDGSPESLAAVRLAHDVADDTGAELQLVDVIEPQFGVGAYPTYWPDWEEIDRGRREEAERQMEALIAELGGRATGEVLAGVPASVLAARATDYDLLVTGSRGYGPLRRLMLGSTSSRLVHEAPCPVLVLTRGATEERDGGKAARAGAKA